MARYKGTVFDPNLVDLLRQTVTGDDLKARLLANRHRALIIDADPEETTVLELRMLEQGFEVTQAHTSDQALKVLERGESRDRGVRARPQAERRLRAARAGAQASPGEPSCPGCS